jgi:hypothetical protein
MSASFTIVGFCENKKLGTESSVCDIESWWPDQRPAQNAKIPKESGRNSRNAPVEGPSFAWPEVDHSINDEAAVVEYCLAPHNERATSKKYASKQHFPWIGPIRKIQGIHR